MVSTLLFALVVAGMPARRVEVAGERIMLGTLVPSMPEPWASVDVGPSPMPMQGRWISAQVMENRVLQARLAPSPVPLPRRVRVTRPGQVVSEPFLKGMVLEALGQQLPPDVHLLSLSLSGGVVVPRGAVRVEADVPTQLRDGRQTIMVAVVSQSEGGEKRTPMPVLVELRVPKLDTKPVIERGQDITVVVASDYVRVQTSGVAQQAGRIGDTIAVLPTQGSRVLRGRIIDTRIVEVTP